MDHIRDGKDVQVSQAMLEDVVEAIAAAIISELGYPSLCKWTHLVVGPMIEDYKQINNGESSRFLQILVESAWDSAKHPLCQLNPTPRNVTPWKGFGSMSLP
jgi:hypothetical protein